MAIIVLKASDLRPLIVWSLVSKMGACKQQILLR